MARQREIFRFIVCSKALKVLIKKKYEVSQEKKAEISFFKAEKADSGDLCNTG